MNENMMVANPPVVCKIGIDCRNMACIMIYIRLFQWIGICDQCLADLVKLDSERKNGKLERC